MQQFKNYVMPTSIEVIAYCVLASLILFVDNIKMIIKIVSGADTKDSAQFFYELSAPIRNNINAFLDSVGPSVVDLVIWMVIGCAVVIIAFWLALLAENFLIEKNTLQNFKNQKLKQKEIITFILRLFIRIFAFIVFVSLFIYFVFNLFNQLSNNFYQAFTITSFNTILGALLSVIIVATILYFLVVCVRFVLLKPRVL